MVLPALACAAVLLATAVACSSLIGRMSRDAQASSSTAFACSFRSALLVIALLALLGVRRRPSTVTLPLGLPWLGAHFRLDALAAFFLAVVALGAAAASLFALGYGRHEPAPRRVLPFYPAFLAGMSVVVLADDAFTFLVSWEFMSLSSWALVMAHHRVQRQRPCRIRLSDHGELRHARAAAGVRTARRSRWRLCLCRNPRGAAVGGSRGRRSRSWP